jgi:lambda repressor-like predicted transcriptional regulator
MGVVGCRQELTEMEKRGTGLAFLSVGARWSPCTKRGGGRCGVSMGVVGCRQELTEMEKRGTGLAFLSVGARWSPRTKRGGGRCGGGFVWRE